MRDSPALSFRGLLFIVLSFLLALLLSILPLPAELMLLQPQWLLLVLVYWIMAMPHRVSLGTAWLMGLLLDALYGTLLGEHAMALCIVGFFVQRLHRQMRMFPTLQQAISIFFLTLMYGALILWLQGLSGRMGGHFYEFCLSAFTTMLFWPWFSALLRYYERRLQIY